MMKQIQSKSILWALVIAAGLQFTACKSKPKTDTTDTTTTSVDSGVTTAPPAAPVEIAPDDNLQTGLKDATKDFPDVTAKVDNGEVTLTGTISRDKLPQLLQSVNSLHPKKVNNNLTIK